MLLLSPGPLTATPTRNWFCEATASDFNATTLLDELEELDTLELTELDELDTLLEELLDALLELLLETGGLL